MLAIQVQAVFFVVLMPLLEAETKADFFHFDW
jgi:hypothetical protein